MSCLQGLWIKIPLNTTSFSLMESNSSKKSSKMRSKIVYCVAVLALAVLVFSPQAAEAECCYANWRGKCANCEAPVHAYCSKGGCNMFGCNCDNGCIAGSCRKKRSADEPIVGEDGVDIKTGHDIVRLADTDSDGALNTTEVKLFLGRRGVVVEIDAFRALDVDGNGKLSAREIDADFL